MTSRTYSKLQRKEREANKRIIFWFLISLLFNAMLIRIKSNKYYYNYHMRRHKVKKVGYFLSLFICNPVREIAARAAVE